MKNYIKLLRFLKGHRKLFAAAVVTMLISSFLEIFSISLIVPLFDIAFVKREIVIPNPNLPAFVYQCRDYLNSLDPNVVFPAIIITFLIGLFLKNGFVYLYKHLMSDVSQRVLRDIRLILYQKMQSFSLDFFSQKRTGELISRITHDVQAVENALSYGFTDLFRQSFTILFCVVVPFTIDPKAAMLIFIIFPILALPMQRIGKRLRKIMKGIQEKFADINSLLLETISGVKVVKAFGTEDYETARFKEQNQKFYKLRMSSVKRMNIIAPISEVLGGIIGVGMMWWFGRRVISGELSVGIFILFFASIMTAISPIKKLGNVYAIIQQALAANDRIYEILETKVTVQEMPNAKVIGPLERSIKFEDVDFQYDQESGIVLKGINLEIKKGELVAIVGPTGTGKTTIVNLIPRFYDVTSGAVTLDGVNVKDATFKSLRGQIGIVAQESFLFNDTVKANIAYGHRKAPQLEVEEAAKKAYAHQFIEKMPYGYDTILGERGFRLSGGEKQRISIARAILKNPPILILDEATSQLDSESEKFVQDALDKLMQGRTVVAIAHRLSTIKKADKIIVLEHGQIVGVGPHEELLETCSLYKKLHSMQFQL